MRNLVWSPAFIRAFKRLTRQNPQLRPQEQALQQLAEDLFQPSLHIHKLKGNLSVRWSCSIDLTSVHSIHRQSYTSDSKAAT